jgi:hypothetical protein
LTTLGLVESVAIGEARGPELNSFPIFFKRPGFATLNDPVATSAPK